jgi:hypothetical protein
MAQSPEELRQEIELRAQIRRQREHHRAQAARNLMGKSFLRDGHTRFKDRDAAIRDGIDKNSVRHKIARSVSKDQVPLQASANDLLELTFGRDKRGITDQLTPDDIRQFERNIAVAAENFQGGITPQQVIDWSRQIDRDRANEQIHLAFIAKRDGDLLRFTTNAGPNSQDTFHVVKVQLLGYNSMLTGQREKGIRSIKEHVTGGKIRFTCDCGRHRYYYNYLSGLGNYHLGEKEIRYPKITNPDLGGIACKHVLRVMQVLTSATTAQYLLGQIRQDRARVDNNKAEADTRTKTQMHQDIERQTQQADYKRNQVLTQEQRPGFREKMKREAQRAATAQAAREAATQSDTQMRRSIRARLTSGLPLSKDQSDWLLRNLT